MNKGNLNNKPCGNLFVFSKGLMALVAIALLLSVSACKHNTTAKDTEDQENTRYTTYKGTLNMDADAGLQSIMRQQVEVFDYLYDSVETNIAYKSEKEMLEDFKTRKAKLLILSRALTPAEIESFKVNDTIYIRQQPVAYDAVAIIGNKNFDDSKLDLAGLKAYFDPNKSATRQSPELVFEKESSGTVRFVLDTLGYKEKVSPNMYALQSANDVINYVADSKNAIGFIPYNLISDGDDDRVKKILERIKILSLRAKTSDGQAIRVSANQSDIAVGDYPLIRTLNAVTHYTYKDNLELLMIGFLTREKGAKIFLKAGLMPVKMPEREINVNEGPLKSGK